MSTNNERRRFLRSASASLVAVSLAATSTRSQTGAPGRAAGTTGNRSQLRATPPLAISSSNGLAAVAKAVEIMSRGGDTLDAVIEGVKIVELDPKDNSVGFGGLPNEQGVVELDASVMHGPTRRAGAVASIRGVRTPSEVARAVMERTDHILIVGEGARAFATAHGFENIDLLTPESRLAYLRWKETNSDNDKWGPSRYRTEPASPAGRRRLEEIYGRETAAFARQIAPGSDRSPEDLMRWADEVVRRPPTGTINCLGLNAESDISGVTTTSGLAWKIPGRVGDSPLIGCGLYVDNDTGAAGSTGRGEEVVYINGARTVVEYMRRGASPADACIDALRLIAARYGSSEDRLRDIDVNFYAVNKRGEYAGAAIWSHSVGTRGARRRGQFAVGDISGARLVECAYLFERRA